MLLLAANPSIGPTEIGNLVLGLIQLLTLWKLIQRKPPIEAEFATNQDLDKHAAENKHDIEGIHSKVGGVERGLRSTMTDVGNKVAALDERTQGISNQVSMLQNTINDFLREERRRRQ